MSFAEKLKLIRTRERLTQRQISEMVCIKLGTWKGYEYGARADLSAVEISKLLRHPRFIQYTLWLMTDQTIPEAGQVSPE